MQRKPDVYCHLMFSKNDLHIVREGIGRGQFCLAAEVSFDSK